MKKHLIIAIVTSYTTLFAASLQTSDHLSNLEIVTEYDCPNQHSTQMAQAHQAPEVKLPKTLEVETVNYKLHGCNGSSSFPVTVRSHKKLGE